MRISALHYGTSVPPNFLFRPVRTRLLNELGSKSTEQQKILSIVAPVGYGKTVLMTQLHAQLQDQGQRCLWVGLGHREVTVERIAQLLKTAMAAPQNEDHPTPILFTGNEPIGRLIDGLVDAISHLSVATTIFIDNLNSCSDESLGDVLDALIFRTPPHIRFVWSSTTVPAIDIGRAKLQGLLRQIGFSDLNLNADEAQELLGASVAECIGSGGTAAVLRRTEGWAAGIRMAQIALTNAEQPLAILEDFSGSDEDVSAMLNRQVLAGFSPELRDFLLALSLFNTFSVDLCTHLVGTDQARQHLDILLTRNIFIIPLDRNRKRYRFHGLFREYLLSEADRLFDQSRRQSIFKRAAVWCEKSQEWEDAITYALEAGEFGQASRILDRTATIFVRDRGDIQRYSQWVEQLLPTGIEIGWEAHFWYIWALVFNRRFGQGMKHQELLAERVRRHDETGDGPTAAPPDDLLQRIDHVRICIELYTDHLGDAHLHADQWLNTVSKCEQYNIGSVYCIKAICLSNEFRFAEARQAMQRCENIFAEIGGAYTMGWVALVNGFMSMYEGNFAVALNRLQQGLAQAREALGDEAIVCGLLAFANAKCAVEMGFDDEANRLFHFGLRTAHVHGLVDTASYGFETAVKLWNGLSNEDSAHAISIDHLHQIAGNYPQRLALTLSCYLVRRLLRLGRTQEAFAEAEKAGLAVNAEGSPYPEQLTNPRYRDLFAATTIDLHIARREFRQAESLISQEFHLAQKEGRFGRLVELCLVKMSIAMQTDNPSAAAKALSQAVSTAARRRIVRPFSDHAELIAAQVNDTKPSAWIFAQEEERKFFAEICSRLPISNPLQHDLPGNWGQECGLPVAPTKKESELLSLLDLGLSNQQIADYSNVSITTIKWHLKNLYRKFDVPNRSAALARARSMRLLSQ